MEDYTGKQCDRRNKHAIDQTPGVNRRSRNADLRNAVYGVLKTRIRCQSSPKEKLKFYNRNLIFCHGDNLSSKVHKIHKTTYVQNMYVTVHLYDVYVQFIISNPLKKNHLSIELKADEMEFHLAAKNEVK